MNAIQELKLKKFMKNNIDKQRLIEELRKTPIVQVACQKINISRATYYRLRKQDAEFAKLADGALAEGRIIVNELGEAQTISLMKERDMQAIRFWLSHNDPRYSNKLEIKGFIHNTNDKITPEQEELLRQALKFALPQNSYEQTKEKFETDSRDDDQGPEL